MLEIFCSIYTTIKMSIYLSLMFKFYFYNISRFYYAFSVFNSNRYFNDIYTSLYKLIVFIDIKKYKLY